MSATIPPRTKRLKGVVKRDERSFKNVRDSVLSVMAMVLSACLGWQLPIELPPPHSMSTQQASPRLLVQICSYNSNLQGEAALPQDLVDWLAPTFTTSKFLARNSAPDIIVVGFQELLPLHLSCMASLKQFYMRR